MDDFNTKRGGVPVMIVETGEVFNSIQACADYLDADVHWVGQIVRKVKNNRTCHGYHIVRLDGKYDKPKEPLIDGRGRPGIKVRVIETGEVFNSMLECAEALDGCVSMVYETLHNVRGRTTYKGYHLEVVE